MATKKETTETVEVQVTADPWSVKEEIFLPVESGQESFLYVSLNHYSAQIPRGQQVTVPKPVADMIRERDTLRMQHRAYSRMEAEKATRANTPDGGVIRL